MNPPSSQQTTRTDYLLHYFNNIRDALYCVLAKYCIICLSVIVIYTWYCIVDADPSLLHCMNRAVQKEHIRYSFRYNP